MDYARKAHSMDGFLDDVKGFLTDVKDVGRKVQDVQGAWNGQTSSPSATQDQNAAIMNALLARAGTQAVTPAKPSVLTPQMKKYLLWGGIGLGSLLVVAVVMKSVRR